MKPIAVVAFCFSLVFVGACGRSMNQRVRARGASDLHCPDVTAWETGLGGWDVQGCARRASYVCAREVCALQTRIVETSAPDQASERAWSIEGWSCRYYGATATDQTDANSALARQSASIRQCRTSSFVASVGPTRDALQLMEVDGDEGCAHDAIWGLRLSSSHASGFTMRCDRE